MFLPMRLTAVIAAMLRIVSLARTQGRARDAGQPHRQFGRMVERQCPGGNVAIADYGRHNKICRDRAADGLQHDQVPNP